MIAENDDDDYSAATGCTAPTREISQMSPISSQSLNGANSASRGAREGLKKGNSSEFNPQDYEQVKSSPSLKVWSHEVSNLYPKMAQKG